MSNTPSNEDIDLLVRACLGDCGPQANRVYSFVTAVLARWGTPQPAPAAQGDAASLSAQAEGWISVQDELPKCSKKPDSFGVEVLIWPPHEDGSRTAFYGRRQSREPNFYKYGALLGHVEFWRYPPPPPTSSVVVEHG